MKPLYELSNDYQKLIDNLFDCDYPTPEHLDMLGSIEEDIKQKSINVGLAIRNLENLRDGIEKEMDSMQKRLLKVNKNLEWLKSYLINNLTQLNIKKVESPYFNIVIRENNYSLSEHDSSLTPEKYINTKVTTSIDRRAIIEDLKNGEEIPGWSFKNSKSVLLK